MNVASEKVYEERNSNVGLGETIRFRIPPSIALLNTQQTFLKFNVVVGAKGKQANFASGDEADENHWFPWTFGAGGAGNLIRNLTIKTQDGVIIEQITDYNRLNRVLVNYVENSSEKNLKALYQGADSDYVKETNVLTRRSTNQAGASTAGETQENMEVEIVLPLTLSGVLNNPQPYPNMIAPLEVEILLEDEVYNVIHAQGNELGGEAGNFEDSKNAQPVVGGYAETFPYAVDGTPQNATTTLNILRTNSGGTNFYTGDIDASMTANFPFYNGQELIVKCSTGDIEIVVNNVELDVNKLKINFDSVDFGANATANPLIFVNIPDEKPTMTLSELELVCGTIAPSSQQLKAIESAVNSGQGYGWQYKSYQDFPVNMSAGALQVSNLINCNYRMTKAILSFWENVGETTIVYEDNLLVQNDNLVKPKSYIYKLGGLLVPNREVDLSRYTRARNQAGGWGASHIKELEQALGCCGWRVKDLSNIDGCLLLGRGLVPVNSGFTYDMSGNEESRLQLKYTTQSESLLQHNYVCHLKELRISNKGKMVIE
jgi:hypothetical protein